MLSAAHIAFNAIETTHLYGISRGRFEIDFFWCLDCNKVLVYSPGFGRQFMGPTFPVFLDCEPKVDVFLAELA